MLALFVAMGGTAIALKNNEVKSKHIKDGQVKSADLKDNSVKSKDLKDGQIKGADVKSDSLGADQIDESGLGQVPDADRVDGVEMVTLDFRGGIGESSSFHLADMTITARCDAGFDLEVEIHKQTPDSGAVAWMAATDEGGYESDVRQLFLKTDSPSAPSPIDFSDPAESGSTGQISYQDNDSAGSDGRGETRHIVTVHFQMDEKAGDGFCIFTGHALVSEA